MLKIAVSGMALLAGLTAHAADWEKTEETKDGITCYRREVPGSDLIAFRGEGVVDAPLPLIATIITDTDQGTQWVVDLEESRILKWEDPTHFIEYDHFGTPIVMKDRDFVTRGTITVDKAARTFTLEFKSIDFPEAPKTSYIRGDVIHGTFVLKPVDGDSKTHVDADIHVDPKGSVAKWIVNFFQKDWPVDTFRNLRKQAAKKGPVAHRFSALFTQGVLPQ